MIYDFEYGKQNGEARHTERDGEREREDGREKGQLVLTALRGA